MTTERFGPRPVEADIARNVTDLLNRAYGQDLTPEEAKAIAVDANRPARPRTEEPDDRTEQASEAESDERMEPDLAVNQGGYDVFNPGDVPWRL